MVLSFFLAAKALDGRSQVSTTHVGKLFDAPPALPKAPRKALGTVNRASEKSVKSNGPLKQKQTTFPAKKVSIVYKDTKFEHFSTLTLKMTWHPIWLSSQ